MTALGVRRISLRMIQAQDRLDANTTTRPTAASTPAMPPRGSPVSAATLTRIRATLRAALNAAIRRGLLADNPASRAELPRARRPRAVMWTPGRIELWQRTGERPAVAVWTAAQTAQFLNTIEDHRLYAAYHLIALRGLRRGEAAGLRWCDVDLDGKPVPRGTGCYRFRTGHPSKHGANIGADLQHEFAGGVVTVRNSSSDPSDAGRDRRRDGGGRGRSRDGDARACQAASVVVTVRVWSAKLATSSKWPPSAWT